MIAIPAEMVEAIATDVREALEGYELALVTYDGAKARRALNKYRCICDELAKIGLTLAEIGL